MGGIKGKAGKPEQTHVVARMELLRQADVGMSVSTGLQGSLCEMVHAIVALKRLGLSSDVSYKRLQDWFEEFEKYSKLHMERSAPSSLAESETQQSFRERADGKVANLVGEMKRFAKPYKMDQDVINAMCTRALLLLLMATCGCLIAVTHYPFQPQVDNDSEVTLVRYCVEIRVFMAEIEKRMGRVRGALRAERETEQ